MENRSKFDSRPLATDLGKYVNWAKVEELLASLPPEENAPPSPSSASPSPPPKIAPAIPPPPTAAETADRYINWQKGGSGMQAPPHSPGPTPTAPKIAPAIPSQERTAPLSPPAQIRTVSAPPPAHQSPPGVAPRNLDEGEIAERVQRVNRRISELRGAGRRTAPTPLRRPDRGLSVERGMRREGGEKFSEGFRMGGF